MPSNCPICQSLRTVFVCAITGSAAGLLSIRWGAGQQLSMLATFLGAIAPILWIARKKRHKPQD